MIQRIHSMKITSDMAYIAAFASIFLSIALWAMRSTADDKASGERLGIFVGLWAPTLSILGRALEETERKIKIQS